MPVSQSRPIGVGLGDSAGGVLGKESMSFLAMKYMEPAVGNGPLLGVGFRLHAHGDTDCTIAGILRCVAIGIGSKHLMMFGGGKVIDGIIEWERERRRPFDGVAVGEIGDGIIAVDCHPGRGRRGIASTSWEGRPCAAKDGRDCRLEYAPTRRVVHRSAPMPLALPPHGTRHCYQGGKQSTPTILPPPQRGTWSR